MNTSISVTFASVGDLLADARSRIERLSPFQAHEAVANGALVVDIRPVWQRDAEIPGAWIIDRNHLEWRLHPASDARIAAAASGQRWIVVCEHGYTSSLAADALRSLGIPAADLDGGVTAWHAAGLPVTPGPTANETIVADGWVMPSGVRDYSAGTSPG